MPKRKTKHKSLKIGVIGAGAWGTAIANLLSKKGHSVTLWAREKEVIQSIQKKSENKLFLPGIDLHKKLNTTALLEEGCNADVLVMATPSQFLRETLKNTCKSISPKSMIVNVSKGIEVKTGKLLSQVYEEIFPQKFHKQIAYLSGPSFALEVARGLPAAVTLACESPTVSKKLQEVFSSPTFRIYTTADVVGVELGGALKNVIAIAIGILDGLEMGNNARAGMITRALHEMTRLGHKMGASPLTFMGLAGLGDLILTCTGSLSRNRTVGLELAKGKSLEQITKGRRSVAEGVTTAAAVYKLARKYKVDMPISQKVYEILYKKKPLYKAIQELAARPLKREMHGL